MLVAWSEAQERLAGSAGERALERPLVVFDIFTDSSSSSD